MRILLRGSAVDIAAVVAGLRRVHFPAHIRSLVWNGPVVAHSGAEAAAAVCAQSKKSCADDAVRARPRLPWDRGTGGPAPVVTWTGQRWTATLARSFFGLRKNIHEHVEALSS